MLNIPARKSLDSMWNTTLCRSIKDALEDAEKHLKQNRLDQATKTYISVLSKDPQNIIAQAGLQNAKNMHLQYLIHLFNQNDYAALLVKAEESLMFFPEAYEIHNLLGGALSRQGKFEAALESYQNALKIKPESPDVCSNAAIALKELGRHDEALAFYDRAIDLDPEFINAYFNKSNLLRDLKRNTEAIKGYDRVLELSPMNASAHSNKGLIFQELGQTRESLKAFQKATQCESPSWEIYFNYNRNE